MTIREKVQELVEQLIDEPYLEDVDFENGKTSFGRVADLVTDIVGEIEDLANGIMTQIEEDFENAEPQFDTLGEERGER